jgi:tetratricopeptide (TPR) repeat protein
MIMKTMFSFIIFLLLNSTLLSQNTTENRELLLIAIEHLSKGEYKKAIPVLDSCIKLNPSEARLYNLLGCATIYQDVLNHTKNNLAALRLFDKAINLDTTNYRFYTNRAFARQMLDNYAGSLADHKKALSFDTTNVELHANVLRLLWIQRKNKQAFDYANKMTQDFPLNGYAYHVRGQLKRDWLHKYLEGNKDIKKSEVLGWRQGLELYY